MGKRRVELSGTKVAASVLATVTGATAASRFGVAGTLTGTVVMSIASSAGTTVYQHYLNRGGDKVRAISPGHVPRPRSADGGRAQDWDGGDTGPDRSGAGGAAPTEGGVATTVGDVTPAENGGAPTRVTPAENGAAPTRVTPAEDGAAPTRVTPAEDGAAPTRVTPAEDGAAPTRVAPAGDWGAPAEGGTYSGTDEQTATAHLGATSLALVHFPAVSGGFPAVSGGFPARPEGNGAPGSTARWKQFGREADWKRVAVAAAATLLLAIVVITVIELAAGRPLGALVGGKHASGTSIGSVIARHPSTGRSQIPSGPGSRAPVQTPAQPAKTSGPTPARSQPATPAPVPTAPASRPASGGGGSTGNAVSPAVTP